jgi:hypothetical protein
MSDQNKHVIIRGDDLTVAFMDGVGGRCSRLRIYKSRDEMMKGLPPVVEINFSSASKLRLFWILNLQCVATIWRKLFGRSIFAEERGERHVRDLAEAIKGGH